MKKFFLIFYFVEKYFDNFLLIIFLVGWINVEWDIGFIMFYRYGNNGMIIVYDIEFCDELRIFED